VTKEEREAAVQEKDKRILEEQQLANLMHKGLLLEALGLAIHLDQPFRTLNILKGMLVLRCTIWSTFNNRLLLQI